MTSQTAFCDLNIALAVQFKLHNGNTLKYPRLFLMFYLQIILSFGSAFKFLTVFMFVYKLLEERVVDSLGVCVVLTTIWVMYICVT